MKTKDARSLPPAGQAHIRRKAVKAVQAGNKQVDVAKMFGVTRQALGKWMRKCSEEGIESLNAKKRGRHPGGSLKPWQASVIARQVIERPPDQLKLCFYLWTREAVARLIEKRFHIKISKWTVGRYLKNWGLTPQKPVRRAFEQNPQEVQNWLKEEYPGIRALAKEEKAKIYWGDEMGLRSDHASGRTYGLRGQTPVVFGTGNRFGCNMVSAITNRGDLNFMIFNKRFRAGIFMDFLWRLVRQAKCKVFLIIDRHPVHRSSKVRAWLQKHAAEIRVFYLPSYSPELNPDEMLNQDVKSNALCKRRAKDQSELMSNIRGFLWGRQKYPVIVKRYFHEKHVQYAAS